MRVTRDVCAPTNKVVKKLSMTPLREIRENPKKFWYPVDMNPPENLKRTETRKLKTIGEDDERLTFWFSIHQNKRSANDMEQWD